LFSWADDPEPHIRAAQTLGARSRAAGSNDADVLAYNAIVLFSPYGDRDTAFGLADRAISINPGSSVAWAFSGWLHMNAGQAERGIDHLQRAMRLDPFSSARSMHLAGVGIAQLELRRFDEALVTLKEAAELRANDPVPYPFIAAVCGHLGRLDEARAALAKYAALSATPLDTLAAAFLYDAAHLALFLDGIALA